MIVFTSDRVQDTLKASPMPSKEFPKAAGKAVSSQSGDTGPVSYDTTLVCRRNSIADVSFYDEGSFIKDLSVPKNDQTVISLAAKAKDIRAEKTEILKTHLRSGVNLTPGLPDKDLVLTVLLAAAFLLTIVRASVKNTHPVARFFLFKGFDDHASSDTGILFHWQTTLLNLMSFFIISLFACQAATIQGLLPPGFSGTLSWLICLGIIIVALTLRHFICVATGNLSGHSDVFNEYLVGIYQSYHIAALILFILVLLATFTVFLPSNVFVIAGICGIALMYLIRVTRLLLIFINRNISVLYLILYLCALEILPVAILIRYFSAL